MAQGKQTKLHSVRCCVTVAQGHSRSSKLVQSKGRMRFPISLHCNYVPIFYRFRDKTIHWSIRCVFSRFITSVSLKALAGSVPPVTYDMKFDVKQLESVGYLTVKTARSCVL